MKFLSIPVAVSCALALFVCSPVAGQITPYSQDFDSLTAPDAGVENSDLAMDGWVVFGNAFNAAGEFQYQFDQTFPAPNLGEGGAFSGIDTGEPTTSGSNYLNIFSDFNNPDHTNGSNFTITSFVFRSDIVGAEDVGDTWTLSYDFRTAISPFGVADSNGATTTAAFITVLDSISGTFFTLASVETDTSAATTTFTPSSVSLLIEDVHVGQTIQYGFQNSASNESASGVYYDTISFAVASDAVVGDFNGDGLVDCDDLDGFVGNLDAAATGALAALDIDSSGTLTQDDVDAVVTDLIVTSNGVTGTFLGDLNCDGQVNVLGDALALVGSLGQDVTSYSDGDINLDGTVNVLGDALILVTNLGESNGP